MFKSKRVKKLEKEISELKEQLSIEQQKTKTSAFIDAAKLSKCKSLACLNCAHIAYWDSLDRVYILGCGKDKRCSDFCPIQIPEETHKLLQADLLKQGML